MDRLTIWGFLSPRGKIWWGLDSESQHTQLARSILSKKRIYIGGEPPKEEILKRGYISFEVTDGDADFMGHRDTTGFRKRVLDFIRNRETIFGSVSWYFHAAYDAKHFEDTDAACRWLILNNRVRKPRRKTLNARKQ